MSSYRNIQVNQLTLDQADFFQSDGFTRILGITAADLTAQVFFNNTLQPWPVQVGEAVQDAHIVSGKVYFHEVPGSPGVYSVRMRPNAVGFWRVLLTYPPGLQILAQEYDVSAQTQMISSGVKSSFSRS